AAARGTPVAKGGEKRHCGRKFESHIRARPDMARHSQKDGFVRVNRSGQAAIGIADEPAAIFNGPHTRNAQMLFRSGGAAKPAVVGDIDEQLRAVSGEVADLVRVDRLVNDGYAEKSDAWPFAHRVQRWSL